MERTEYVTCLQEEAKNGQAMALGCHAQWPDRFGAITEGDVFAVAVIGAGEMATMVNAGLNTPAIQQPNYGTVDSDITPDSFIPPRTWGNLNTLDDHFGRHGADFGATSKQDYAQKANDFFGNRGNYQVKVDTDGIIRVYDPQTNSFGSYNPDGTTRTFFKPKSPTYFQRQPGS